MMVDVLPDKCMDSTLVENGEGLCCHLKMKVLTFRSIIFDMPVKWYNNMPTIFYFSSDCKIWHGFGNDKVK